MVQPYNYNINIPNPAQQLTQAAQGAYGISGLMQKREQAQQQAQRQQQIQAAISGLGADSTAADYAAVANMLPPEQAESLRENYGMMSEEQQQSSLGFAGQIMSAMRVSPEIGVRMLQEKAEAARNSGDTDQAKAYESWAEIARTDPDAAFSSIATIISALPGGVDVVQKTLDVQAGERAQELQPGVIRRQAADLNLTKAQTNKELVAARKMEAEIAKTNAEASKVAAEAAQRAMELKYGKPVELTTEGEKLLNKSVADAANSASLATQYNNLAGQIEEEISTAGATGRAAEVTKRFFGSENQVTRLRQEYQRLRNSAVLTMLPPGVASDKDIEIAMGAFPSETSNPELIASFMRGMAKMQRYDSQLNNLKAEWISEVGNLGKAKQGVQVAGEEVIPGTNFNDFVESQISVPDTISDTAPAESAQAGTPDTGQVAPTGTVTLTPEGRAALSKYLPGAQ